MGYLLLQKDIVEIEQKGQAFWATRSLFSPKPSPPTPSQTFNATPPHHLFTFLKLLIEPELTPSSNIVVSPHRTTTQPRPQHQSRATPPTASPPNPRYRHAQPMMFEVGRHDSVRVMVTIHTLFTVMI
ncbi:hypothetical protein HKD37_08G023644 [Glycine soja]